MEWPALARHGRHVVGGPLDNRPSEPEPSPSAPATYIATPGPSLRRHDPKGSTRAGEATGISRQPRIKNRITAPKSRATSSLTRSPAKVCKVYETGEVDGKAYIAMEYIDGQSLDRIGKRLPLLEKVQIIRDVAQALHSAHEIGIIHRDIKPAKVTPVGV